MVSSFSCAITSADVPENSRAEKTYFIGVCHSSTESVGQARIRCCSRVHQEIVKAADLLPACRAGLYDVPVKAPPRPTPDQWLARLKEEGRARLRIYIGAAPGVGKTYTMLKDAHAIKRQGVDVVIGLVEAFGRGDTEAQIGDLEIIPLRHVPYRGVTIDEIDVDAIVTRKPALCLVDELAHTNVQGSRHEKRYQDVLDILDGGISVMTAVNIQHLETLNDLVSRVTGVRVRETVPDTFLDRADEVVNVDATVEELRGRHAAGQDLQGREDRAGSGELLPRWQSLDAPRTGPSRRGRRGG